MQSNVTKNISSHPSSEELAYFVDEKLGEERRAEVVKHLIECDECSDVVALIVKYGEEEVIDIFKDNTPNKPQIMPKGGRGVEYKYPNESQIIPQDNSVVEVKYANNWFYDERVRAIVLSGLVASFLVFWIIPSGNNELGMIDLSKPLSIQYQGGENIILRDETVDADKILFSIIKLTDLSKIKNFQYAQEKEKRGEIKEAKAFYKQAFIKSLIEKDDKERLKKKIVIHSKLFHLSKDKELNEYRDILRYEIRLYILKFDTRSKK